MKRAQRPTGLTNSIPVSKFQTTSRGSVVSIKGSFSLHKPTRAWLIKEGFRIKSKRQNRLGYIYELKDKQGHHVTAKYYRSSGISLKGTGLS
jgi:hypothetical protein